MRVAVLHPDLGLGGAERLILDAVLELQAAGHDVQLFTAHHETGRCFKETLVGALRSAPPAVTAHARLQTANAHRGCTCTRTGCRALY